jgi:hypothetical protein
MKEFNSCFSFIGTRERKCPRNDYVENALTKYTILRDLVVVIVELNVVLGVNC